MRSICVVIGLGFSQAAFSISPYEVLRDLSGTTEGETTSLSAPYISGNFAFSATDPNGNGDDNGLVIAAPNGFWIRQYPSYDINNPIELDWFELANNDNITALLKSLAKLKTPELYLRAPSQPMELISEYIRWNDYALIPAPDYLITRFAFYESTAMVTIKHPLQLIARDHFVNQTTGIIDPSITLAPGFVRITEVDKPTEYTMWQFEDADEIRIGGTELRLNFKGNHPGLGIGGYGYFNPGDYKDGLFNIGHNNPPNGTALIHVLVPYRATSRPNPELLDFRANVYDSLTNGLNIETQWPPIAGQDEAKPIQQANFSGLFWNSGIRLNGAVTTAWYDPGLNTNNPGNPTGQNDPDSDYRKNRGTVLADPYNTANGWDGSTTAHPDSNFTRPVGCSDGLRQQPNSHPTWGVAVNVDTLLGGVTLEYGTSGTNIFSVDKFGTSLADPFKIRYKDWGASGPATTVTDPLSGNPRLLPAGVHVKKRFKGRIMKHDGLPEYGDAHTYQRFLLIEELPPTFGNGLLSTYSLPDAECAPDNGTTNVYPASAAALWAAEASSDGGSYPYFTSHIDVTFKNVDLVNWVGQVYSDNIGMYACASSGFDRPTPPGGVPTWDRSYAHTLRSAAGSSLPTNVGLFDHCTLTGPGAWEDVIVNPITSDVKIDPTDTSSTAPKIVLYPINNTIHDTSLTGELTIGESAINTVLTNVSWSGIAREIMTIDTGSDVHATNLTPPVGSTVTGAGSFDFDGTIVSLPYTFQDGDSDTIWDSHDNCIGLANTPQTNTDGDSEGDACDLDDDNDGLNDLDEPTHGTNPLLSDTDGDGYLDGAEVSSGSDPTLATSTPATGDINEDGQVDVADVLLAIRFALGLAVPTEQQTLRADVAPLSSGIPQADGSITAGDVVVIQAKALGLISF